MKIDQTAAIDTLVVCGLIEWKYTAEVNVFVNSFDSLTRGMLEREVIIILCSSNVFSQKFVFWFSFVQFCVGLVYFCISFSIDTTAMFTFSFTRM